MNVVSAAAVSATQCARSSGAVNDARAAATLGSIPHQIGARQGAGARTAEPCPIGHRFVIGQASDRIGPGPRARDGLRGVATELTCIPLR